MISNLKLIWRLSSLTVIPIHSCVFCYKLLAFLKTNACCRFFRDIYFKRVFLNIVCCFQHQSEEKCQQNYLFNDKPTTLHVWSLSASVFLITSRTKEHSASLVSLNLLHVLERLDCSLTLQYTIFYNLIKYFHQPTIFPPRIILAS